MNTAQTIERTALTQLVTNEEYARKVLPHMKGDYFHDKTERTIFEEITKFVEKYDKVPTQTSLEIEVQGRKDLNEEEFKKVVSVIKSLKADENANLDWLVDVTEEFCKDKAVYNAIVEGISIIDGKDKHREIQMLYQAFLLMPWLLGLMILLAMIISWTAMLDLTTITG